ncbi:hypothetical protein DICVIV_10673 [Dictyocaulus viviparus]|uniref:Uncharacterized protein n=1 Tax=Dictyocaulus viviparus TaxID=29172 RepID=A0A0D8XFF6_DICVI|nr:hypothetical protein DICVIV_10673 [Dictyocaulus viviparus]
MKTKDAGVLPQRVSFKSVLNTVQDDSEANQTFSSSEVCEYYVNNLKSFETQITTLNKQFASTNHHMEEMKRSNQTRVEELTNEFKKLTAKRRKREKKENNQLSDQLRTARDSLTVLQVKVDFLEQAMQQEKNRLDFLECRKRENAAFELQLHQMQDEYRSAIERIRILNEEKDTVNAKLMEMCTKLEEKENELTSLRTVEGNILTLHNEATKKITALEHQQEKQEHNLNEIQYAISSGRNHTALGPDRIRPEHLKNLPPVLIGTLARLFTRYLSECKVPSQWKTSRTVNLNESIEKHTRSLHKDCEITKCDDDVAEIISSLETSIVTSMDNINISNEEYCEFCSATEMHSIIFVLLFVFIYHVKSEAIPKYLRDKLRHASSFLEIAENVEILYHPLYTNKHLQKSYATEGPRQPMRIKAANFIKSSPVQLRNLAVDESMNDRNAMDVDTTEQLSLFGSIKQGSDICQLQSVCVPIPIDNGDPQVVIYPKCYEVMQCVGSCCDAFERCHPHSIRMMERPVS